MFTTGFEKTANVATANSRMKSHKKCTVIRKSAFATGFTKIAYIPKRPYKSKKIESLDPHNEAEAWTAKIDGAHSIADLKKGKTPRFWSHRMSKRTGKPIEYTQKLPHIGQKSPVNAVVRAEVYAIDSKGNAVHPDVVTSMLNSGVTKSLELQKRMGIETKTALIDVDKINGKDVSSKPYSFKRQFLESIVKQNQDFVLPPIAYTAKDKQELLDNILSQQLPETKEGVVVHDLHGAKKAFIKAKVTDDHDVYVRDIFKEEGVKAGRQQMAGGFSYSWTPGGQPVGKVGTGFDHAMKVDMLKNPQKYVGKVARVKAHDVSKNRVLVKPAFLGWHVEKNIQ